MYPLEVGRKGNEAVEGKIGQSLECRLMRKVVAISIKRMHLQLRQYLLLQSLRAVLCFLYISRILLVNNSELNWVEMMASKSSMC